VKLSEIWEETVYRFECPKCENISETEQDPDYIESVCCEHCGEEFQLEDD
jgi:transcription elongation factor Elf1